MLQITRSPLTVTVMEDLQDRLHLSELIASLKGARHKWRDLVEIRMDSTIQSSRFEKNSRAEVLMFAGYVTITYGRKAFHLWSLLRERYLSFFCLYLSTGYINIAVCKMSYIFCLWRNQKYTTRMQTINGNKSGRSDKTENTRNLTPHTRVRILIIGIFPGTKTPPPPLYSRS